MLGSNGAGKSTALHVIAGLVRPDRGLVRVGQRVLTDTTAGVHVATHDRRVCLLLQDPLLFPHLSVTATSRSAAPRQVPALPRRPIGSPRSMRPNSATSMPRQLSGGQAQRVALARALAAEPDVLLLDEPMAGLDVAAATAMRKVLRRVLARDGRCAVLVTHDLLDVLTLADRVLVLEAGPDRRIGRGRSGAGDTAQPVRCALRRGEPGRRHRSRRWCATSPSGARRGTAARGPTWWLVEPAVAVFHPAAVAVYRDEPHGSPRNAVEVTVAELDSRGAAIRVRADQQPDGAPGLAADITTEAAAELRLAPGDCVYFVGEGPGGRPFIRAHDGAATTRGEPRYVSNRARRPAIRMPLFFSSNLLAERYLSNSHLRHGGNTVVSSTWISRTRFRTPQEPLEIAGDRRASRAPPRCRSPSGGRHSPTRYPTASSAGAPACRPRPRRRRAALPRGSQRAATARRPTPTRRRRSQRAAAPPPPEPGRVDNAAGGFSYVVPAGWKVSDATKLVLRAGAVDQGFPGARPTEQAPTDTSVLLGRLDLKLFAGRRDRQRQGRQPARFRHGRVLHAVPRHPDQPADRSAQRGRHGGRASYYEVKFTDTTKPDGQIWAGVVGRAAPAGTPVGQRAPQRWFVVWLGTANNPVTARRHRAGTIDPAVRAAASTTTGPNAPPPPEVERNVPLSAPRLGCRPVTNAPPDMQPPG